MSIQQFYRNSPEITVIPTILTNLLDFEFSLVRLASMAVGFLFVLIGSLAAWSAHEGVGAQQAAGAFGALAGICYGVLTFFAFQMRKEELEKRANEGKFKYGKAHAYGHNPRNLKIFRFFLKFNFQKIQKRRPKQKVTHLQLIEVRNQILFRVAKAVEWVTAFEILMKFLLW